MQYESEMISLIKSRLAKSWKRSLVFEEFGVGYGVADVVAVQPNLRGINQRRRLGQTAALLQRGQIRVLHILQNLKTAKFEDLLAFTGISRNRLRYEIIRSLLLENYIEEVEKGHFRRRGQYLPVVRQVWAVEAKMKNWFEGLCQARRYQHFAHQVYLAIFESHRGSVQDNILREHNIGLIVVSSKGADILFHPRPMTPRNRELFLLTNERVWQQIHIP